MAMTLRLNEDDSQRLHERAEAEGTSKHAVVLKALQQYLDAETPADSVGGAVAEVKRRYASTLKRIGE